MMRNATSRRFWVSSGAVLAVLLLGAVGCEDEPCKGDECNAAPIGPSGRDDGNDAGTRVLGCERVCAQLIRNCAVEHWVMIGGSTMGVDECIPFCIGLTDQKRGCLMNARCSNLATCLDGAARPERDSSD